VHFEACESYSAAKAMVTSTADLAAGQGQSDRNDIEHIRSTRQDSSDQLPYVGCAPFRDGLPVHEKGSAAPRLDFRVERILGCRSCVADA